jgi:spore coat protein H
MDKRFLSALAAGIAGAVFLAYAAYAATVLYFNDGDFFFTPRLEAPARALDTIRLEVPPSAAQRLSRKIWPQDEREYESVKSVEINGARHKARIKIRGYERHHFGSDLNTRRRSWRVQLKDKARYRGMRTLNLRRLEFPTYLHGHLPYLVAEKLGLFALKADLVAVHWNGVYYGVMNFWEQLGGEFLELRGRPKGLIFAEAVTQGVRDLWTNPGVSGKENERWTTYPDSEPDERWEPLRKLLRVLQSPDDETFRREIRKILDVDQFVRAVAFWNLGGSFHQDSHNIRLYYNPERKLFEWILWDIAGFHYTVDQFSYRVGEEQDFRLDWCPNPLMHRLFKDPEIVEKRNRILWDWMQKDITREDFKALIEQEAARAAPYVRAENNRLFAWRYFKNSIGRFKNWVDFRYDFIANELNNTRVTFAAAGGALTLRVDGQSGFRLTKIKMRSSGTPVLVLDTNRNAAADPGEPALEARVKNGEAVLVDPPLFLPARKDIPKPYPNPHFSRYSLAPAPADYQILLAGNGGVIERVEGVNSTTGQAILAEDRR